MRAGEEVRKRRTTVGDLEQSRGGKRHALKGSSALKYSVPRAKQTRCIRKLKSTGYRESEKKGISSYWVRQAEYKGSGRGRYQLIEKMDVNHEGSRGGKKHNKPNRHSWKVVLDQRECGHRYICNLNRRIGKWDHNV